MFATALVDTTALWKLVLASLVGGVGVVVAYGLLLLGLSKARAADGRPARQAGFYAVSAACGLFCVAAVVVGIFAMVRKPASPKPKPAKPAVASVGPAAAAGPSSPSSPADPAGPADPADPAGPAGPA